MVESVRKALGINDAVYNERPVPLSLFGNYNEFDPLDDDEDEEEEAGSFSSVGGVVVGSRVMPRHQAVERINLARRRRQKLGVSIPEPCDTGTVDLISGILQGQDSLFSGKVSQCAPDKSEAGTRSSLRVRSAAGVNASVETSRHDSNNVSNGDAAVTDNNAANENGNSDVYDNIVEADPAAGDNDLPSLSAEGLRNLVTRSSDHLPALSENGLAKLSGASNNDDDDIYDPANPNTDDDDALSTPQSS